MCALGAELNYRGELQPRIFSSYWKVVKVVGRFLDFFIMNNKMKYFLGEFLELQPRVDIPFLLLKSGGGFFI